MEKGTMFTTTSKLNCQKINVYSFQSYYQLNVSVINTVVETVGNWYNFQFLNVMS